MGHWVCLCAHVGYWMGVCDMCTWKALDGCTWKGVHGRHWMGVHGEHWIGSASMAIHFELPVMHLHIRTHAHLFRGIVMERNGIFVAFRSVPCFRNGRRFAS